MIELKDLVTEVKYFGAKGNDNMFNLIGYVDVKHVKEDGEVLVFHQNLITRSMDDVAGLTAEEIQALAQTEADEILAGECATKCCEQYITLVNLGLY